MMDGPVQVVGALYYVVERSGQADAAREAGAGVVLKAGAALQVGTPLGLERSGNRIARR